MRRASTERSAPLLPRSFEYLRTQAFAISICDAGVLPREGLRGRPLWPSSELSGVGSPISEWRVGVSLRCLSSLLRLIDDAAVYVLLWQSVSLVCCCGTGAAAHAVCVVVCRLGALPRCNLSKKGR